MAAVTVVPPSVEEPSCAPPTGAVVGQQPFGGARGSGTNDKADSVPDVQRWVSPRTLVATFVPAADYRHPFMAWP